MNVSQVRGEPREGNGPAMTGLSRPFSDSTSRSPLVAVRCGLKVCPLEMGEFPHGDYAHCFRVLVIRVLVTVEYRLCVPSFDEGTCILRGFLRLIRLASLAPLSRTRGGVMTLRRFITTSQDFLFEPSCGQVPHQSASNYSNITPHL